MRLICGLLQLDGTEASETLLRAMAAEMDVPRLRPSLSIWCEGPVALGVLDFSAQAAAVRTLPQDARGIMAADVRLDEPAELAGMANAPQEPQDALLLSAVDRFGPDGLDRVLGDFAFAFWDRSARTLTLGRDAFGIRPLSYVHKPGALCAFASLPKALHGSGIVPKKLDEDAVLRRAARRLRFDDSLIAGIKRLRPAHYLTVSRDGIALARYWELDRKAVGTRECSPADAARELRRLVDEAVACRLPPGGIGAHLSGGLDSSAIAVLAARRLRAEGRTLHAYSFLARLRNDITLEDETEFVKAVIEQETDIDWTPVRPSLTTGEARPVDADKMVPLGSDEPENQVCARAEEQGVGLILSGWGGDEAATFNGRGVFAEHFLHGRWRLLTREAKALAKERGWSLRHVLYGEVVSYLVPDRIALLARRVVGKKPDLQTLSRAALAAGARKRLVANPGERLEMAPDGRENRWRSIIGPHIAERAEIWAQTGARHGLAFAFPLLDRRVVEFALSLPSALFLRGGFRRRLFRDAMAGVLPERVRLRHQKYQPFPGRMLDIAEHKQGFLDRLDALAETGTARRTIDLARLRREVDRFPPPDDLRTAMASGGNPASTVDMIAALHGLATAEYIEQHGGEAETAVDGTA